LLRGRTEAARQVSVVAETSGKVISEPLRKGATIHTGQTLCQLDPGTRMITLKRAQAALAEARARIPAARAALTGAEASVEEAKINENAASRLSEGGFASRTRVARARAVLKTALAGIESANSQIESADAAVEAARAQIAAAEKDIENLTLTAPFAGLLETDTAELGTLLQPGAPCATVIRLDPVKLVGFAPETEIGRINSGAPARGRLATGMEITGKVTFISRSADERTRTFRVEVEVPNTDLAIRDGQTAEILIAAPGSRAHLLPQSAMTLSNDGTLGVRYVTEDSRTGFAPVDLLRDTVQGVWLGNLPENISVIVSGQEYVVAGVKLDVTYREKSQ
jgi:multidrug efflux system membrane fusion protein